MQKAILERIDTKSNKNKLRKSVKSLIYAHKPS